MIKVKLTSRYGYSPFQRQTPGSTGRWGNYQFYVNDDSIKECDWWVVFEGLLKPETVLCPKDRTILITSEPPTIKKYDQKFLDQFHTIITCQENIRHPRVIRTQKAHPWMVGCKFVLGSKFTREDNYSKGYDELKEMKLPLVKDKMISVISSSKQSTPGHVNRLRFMEAVKKHFGDKIDVYGRGIRDFADKWDVIAPYKYHIALENSSYPDYYSEKLIDSFLGGAYPFYYGCPNIDNYFPKGALQPIDINDIKGSIALIESGLAENLYEKNFDLIKKSRDLVLDSYNIFPFLTNEIFRPRESVPAIKEPVTLEMEEVRKSGFLRRAKNALLKIF